jgi:hypothetical protein
MTDENPWISVDDEMPPQGVPVRVWSETPFVASGRKESHDYRSCCSWIKGESDDITHWQRIVGPKKPKESVMVANPTKENMIYKDCDPPGLHSPAFLADRREIQIIWWNNQLEQRLWYWHNDQWNRAI